MKKNVKKIVTIALAFCIMVSAMCLSVFAAEARVRYIICPVCGETAYATDYGYYCDNCGAVYLSVSDTECVHHVDN